MDTAYSLVHHRPGDPTPGSQPGDALLAHNHTLPGYLIRFGQGLKHGFSNPAIDFEHVALVLEDGYIAEAKPRGVVKNHLDDYADKEYVLAYLGASEEDREEMLAFADSVLAARWRYGYLTITSLAVAYLTGSKLVFQRAGTAICSGFYASAATRAGCIFESPPEWVMPAEVAVFFGARLN